MSKKQTETVKVMVRTRPMNQKEFDRGIHSKLYYFIIGCKRIVLNDKSASSVSITKPDEGSSEIPRTFTFDLVYGEDSNQNEVYDECAFGLVESVIEGYNGTIFAYGQTGCGKTHTMMGPASSLDIGGDET